MKKKNEYTDADVEKAKELAEQLTPHKAADNLQSLEAMDKAGESAYAKVKMLVLSMADWFMYGN